MNRFHLNPKTGTPGKCSATVSCPFGDINDDHYATREEARTAYEQAQSPQLFGSARKTASKDLPPYPASLKPDILARMPAAADGTTFEENWATYYEVLTHPEYKSQEDVLSSQLGNPNFGRVRSALEPVWVVEDEFDPYDDNPRYPNEAAGVYPYHARPAGGELMAQIFTRNGGGNRECMCDDTSHQDGLCTGAIVDQLEAREDFARSWDGDDRTYATFLFRVENTDELSQANSEYSLRHQQANLRGQAEAMARGDLSPLAVMPVHQPNQDRLDNLHNEAREIDRKWRDEDKKYDPNGHASLSSISEEYRSGALATFQKPLQDWNELDAVALARVTRRNERNVWLNVKEAKEQQEKVLAHEAAWEEVQDGKVPPATLALLGGERKVKEDLNYRIRIRDSKLGDLAKLEKRLTAHSRYLARRAKVEDQIAEVEPALHWPGRPSSMPESLRGKD